MVEVGQSETEAHRKSSQWPKVEQFEQQNKVLGSSRRGAVVNESD